MEKPALVSFIIYLAVSASLVLSGCVDCIDSGHNGKIPPPAADEYQMVLSNGISREMPVYVDNVQVATVCGDSKGVIVGNFKVSDCSRFKVRNEAQSCTAHLTPCGGYLCFETCSTDCFDTYQYAGDQMEFNLCFEEQCE